MQDQLIHGMKKVAMAWEARLKTPSNIIDNSEKSEILSAIRRIEKLSYRIEKTKPKIDDKELCKAIGDLSYQMYLQFPKLRIPDKSDKISIFKSIGRDGNENLHSDFIAALLNPQETGLFAKELFFELLNYATPAQKNPSGKWSFQTVKREVNLVISEQNKRLDILVQSNDWILAIENKVHSMESENQTLDYFNALKKIHGEKLVCLFLSPTGMAAQCTAFRSISYLKFFEFLVNVRQRINEKIPEQGEELYKFYSRELAQTIIHPTIRANELTGEFLKGMGYGAG
jgi:hypothetical protein